MILDSALDDILEIVGIITKREDAGFGEILREEV
jgi:hypothetical protein